MENKFETIQVDFEEGLAIVTINRPSKLNALNIQVHRELKDCLRELGKAELRGLILTGAGDKAFIAGADIAEMQTMSPGEAQAFSELGQQVTVLLESLPFPSIAAVNGFALGGGFEMAMACDFILASANAVFGLPEVKLGLIPGFGGTQRLARIVGERRAKEIMFSGRNIKAAEAASLGIALEVFADSVELRGAARAWFQTTGKNSLDAIARAKDTLRQGIDLPLAEGLALEARSFGAIFQTPAMVEGTTAFLEKRPASFKGNNT